jgi:DNA repair ATPase RecN
MNSTLEHIGKEIISSYSHLSEKEEIDNFLDEINKFKRELGNLTKALNFLDKSMIRITWLDDLQKKDEIIIKGLIAMGKEANAQLETFIAEQDNLKRTRGIFKKDFEALKEAMNLHLESVLEVEHIIFDLRKNEEFLDLCKLADEL